MGTSRLCRPRYSLLSSKVARNRRASTAPELDGRDKRVMKDEVDVWFSSSRKELSRARFRVSHHRDLKDSLLLKECRLSLSCGNSEKNRRI